MFFLTWMVNIGSCCQKFEEKNNVMSSLSVTQVLMLHAKEQGALQHNCLEHAMANHVSVWDHCHWLAWKLWLQLHCLLEQWHQLSQLPELIAPTNSLLHVDRSLVSPVTKFKPSRRISSFFWVATVESEDVPALRSGWRIHCQRRMWHLRWFLLQWWLCCWLVLSHHQLILRGGGVMLQANACDCRVTRRTSSLMRSQWRACATRTLF